MSVTFHRLVGGTIKINEAQIVVRPTVYGLVVYGTRILLLRVKTTGKWFVPGGGVEEGEDPKDALQREVREEAGIMVQVGEELLKKEHNFYHDPTGGAYEMHITFYRCYPESTELTDTDPVDGKYEETHRPQWVEIDSLDLKDFDTVLHDVIGMVKTQND